jgi:hypothetical protein
MENFYVWDAVIGGYVRRGLFRSRLILAVERINPMQISKPSKTLSRIAKCDSKGLKVIVQFI